MTGTGNATRTVSTRLQTNTILLSIQLVIQAYLTRINLPLHQLQPLLVIGLNDHFPRISLLERLRVTTRHGSHHSVVRKTVLSLSVHHLVGAEPMAHLVQVVMEVLEEVAVVCAFTSLPTATSQLVRDGVLRIHAEHLPIHFALVDQRNGAIHLHLVNVAHVMREVAEVHDIQGIIIAEERADVRQLLLVRVLPGLRNCTVVDHAGSAVEAQFTILEILHNGVEGTLLVDFRLGALATRHLRAALRTREESPSQS